MAIALSKPYELVFEERPGYLYARITAPRVKPGMAFSWLADVADKCADVCCERLLVERDIPEPPTSHALVAINQFVGMRDGQPVAFVNPHDGLVGETLRTQIEAGATLGARVAYFEDIPTAEEWLIAELD